VEYQGRLAKRVTVPALIEAFFAEAPIPHSADGCREMARRLIGLAHQLDFKDGAVPLALKVASRDVMAVVAHEHGVTIKQLRGRQRDQRLSQVRMLAMYLCREVTGLSYPLLGKIFYRDHSTVVHGCQMIQARCRKHPHFAAATARLKSQLSNGGADDNNHEETDKSFRHAGPMDL
jgi:DnaA-like protein